MKFSDTYIPQWELDLATPEEIQVIKDHAEQQKIIKALRKTLAPKLDPYIHEAVTPQLLAEVKSIFIDSLRLIALDHPLLRMPFVEFDIEAVWADENKSIDFNAKNQALKQILNAEYGQAFKFDEVSYGLQHRYEEAIQKEMQEHYKTHYRFSDIPKSDYPVSDRSMSAARLRQSGMIPQGYEVLPVTVIDALIHAGLNAYDCAVGGHLVVDELRHAAVSAQHVLERRKNRGAKTQ